MPTESPTDHLQRAEFPSTTATAPPVVARELPLVAVVAAVTAGDLPCTARHGLASPGTSARATRRSTGDSLVTLVALTWGHEASLQRVGRGTTGERVAVIGRGAYERSSN